ncbi:hypothetical protein D3C81_1735550 [compost metagenome]
MLILQHIIRRPQSQLCKENAAETGGEVLAGMHQDVPLSMFVEKRNDNTEADDFRPRAQNRHDLHEFTPLPV